MIDVRVRVSPRWVRPLRNRERIRFHLGSSEDLGRVVLLDRDELPPGEDCLAQIRMETPIVPALGDRFVLRSYSPLHTMAGGVIVDPHPKKHRRHRPEELEAMARREGGGPLAILLETVARAQLGGLKPKALVEATSLPREEVERLVEEETEAGNLRISGNGRILSADTYRLARRTVLEESRRFRERHPLRWGISREELRSIIGQDVTPSVLGELLSELEADGEVELAGEKVRVGGGDVVFEGEAAVERDRVQGVYDAAGCTPPDLEEVLAAAPDPKLAREVVASLLDQGELVKTTEEIYFGKSAWDLCRATLKKLHERDGSISLGAFRDELGISRKYAVPILERFDAQRITRRDGDARTLLAVD